MIFRQIDEIINGAKTQTRRVVKPNERMMKVANGTPLEFMEVGEKVGDIVGVRHGDGRIKWMVGRDYAVVSKRGTRGVRWNPATGNWYVPESDEDKRTGYEPLRVRVTAIRRERLHQISDEDARAEGVLPNHDIISAGDWYGVTVCGMQVFSLCEAYQALWRSINKRAGTRWNDNPDVWVITFEVLIPDGWCPGCMEFVAGSDDDFSARHDGICYECWQDMRIELGEI